MSEAPTLTLTEAYDAMQTFLNAFWERGGCDRDSDLAMLIAVGHRVPGTFETGDPAQWHDWLAAVDQIKTTGLLQ